MGFRTRTLLALQTLKRRFYQAFSCLVIQSANMSMSKQMSNEVFFMYKEYDNRNGKFASKLFIFEYLAKPKSRQKLKSHGGIPKTPTEALGLSIGILVNTSFFLAPTELILSFYSVRKSCITSNREQ